MVTSEEIYNNFLLECNFIKLVDDVILKSWSKSIKESHGFTVDMKEVWAHELGMVIGFGNSASNTDKSLDGIFFVVIGLNTGEQGYVICPIPKDSALKIVAALTVAIEPKALTNALTFIDEDK